MRKLARLWQNMHLRAKFLLIMLVSTALIGIATIAALQIPLYTYDRQLYQSSSQMILLFAEQMRDKLEDYEDISYRILTDNALQENLSLMKDKSPGTLEWINARMRVANQVAYYSLWFDNTVSFQLKTVQGNFYSHFFELSTGADELTEERIQAAMNHQGRYVWLTEDGERPRLFLVREIREMRGIELETLAWILIEVDFPAVVEQCILGMEQMGVEPRCAVYNEGIYRRPGPHRRGGGLRQF